MDRKALTGILASLLAAVSAPVGCGEGSDATSTDPNADAGSVDAEGDAVDDTSTSADSSTVPSDGESDGPTLDADASPPDPCGSALFCETFDSYSAVSSVTGGQKFGPWQAELKSGASMVLDGAHKRSGANALHVHIDNGVTEGGRLHTTGGQPIFASKPTHLYGRMMMYIDPNGTSIHWTFFGVGGKVPAGSPAAGESAAYILSSLPNKVNTYSFVYGLSAPDGYHDCSSQSKTPMPTATWACVSFEIDSVARKLRMYKDDATTPILSVDDHGTGCVAPTSVTSPWYGPAIDSLFVGAFSFHAMNAPLDVWIDDLVVDTKPVNCPAP
ncbi:MAG: hypothetical protein ACXVEF_38865 [Polyangiales bacterium]